MTDRPLCFPQRQDQGPGCRGGRTLGRANSEKGMEIVDLEGGNNIPLHEQI